MKPLTTFGLASANLSRKPVRTLSLALIVAIFAFILFAGSMISANLQAGIESLSARMGADLLVVPQGQGKKIENVLLRAVPSTFYLPENIIDRVKKVPGVNQVSGQLFISSLDAQCCSVKVQLIGIDQDTDFVVEPWLRAKVDRRLKDNEVIVGNYIFGAIGSTIRFYNHDFTIVGQLEPTGMGFDSSVFMTLDAARALGKVAMPEKADEIGKSVSSVLVRVNSDIEPIQVSDGILDELGMRSGVNFVYASNMMSDTAAKLRRIVNIMYSTAAGLWVVAALILFVVFFFAFNERQREFATLRALGAPKRTVVTMVMLEALLISVVGTALGVGLGALVVQTFSFNIARTIGLPYLAPAASAWMQTLCVAVGAGLVTCPLASLQTVWRISCKDIYTSMRED